jgi:hypothetical protein
MPPQSFLCLPKDGPSRLDAQLGSEQQSAQTADYRQIHVVIERVAVVKHDHGSSAGREHPVNLADGPGRIRCVVEHPMGIHEVKRTVSERQVLGVPLNETSIQVCQLKTPARYAHRRVRQVDRGVIGPGASEAFGLAAASTTDFEPPQSRWFFQSLPPIAVAGAPCICGRQGSDRKPEFLAPRW